MRQKIRSLVPSYLNRIIGTILLGACNGAQFTESAQTPTQTPSPTPTNDYTYLRYDHQNARTGADRLYRPGRLVHFQLSGSLEAWRSAQCSVRRRWLRGIGLPAGDGVHGMGLGMSATGWQTQEPGEKVTISYFEKDYRSLYTELSFLGSSLITGWRSSKIRRRIQLQRFVYIKVDGEAL